MQKTQALAAMIVLGGIGPAGSEVKKTVIELPVPALNSDDSAGGILVAELNGDGKPDFLVTRRGHVAAMDNGGKKLWGLGIDIGVTSQSESNGLPGHNGPGIGAGDLDGDGRPEVIFPVRDGSIEILDGGSGKREAIVRPPVPEGAERWDLAMVADFRGNGDHDVLLQATNKGGYRTGRYLAAYGYEALRKGGPPLWTMDDYVGCAHNGARLADLDGDGRDEVLG
ncbi:MAG: VCBS repeat-containing protein, partial [Akkermansiaceae bacterium]|nr:VCBS repeat-containing protein [Akkermansiaceae bacterium]